MVKQGHHTPQSQFSIWSSTGYSAIQVIMELVILLQPNNMSHCLHSMQNINGGKLGWDEKLLGCGPSPWTMWPEALKAQVSRYFASCKGPWWCTHCTQFCLKENLILENLVFLLVMLQLEQLKTGLRSLMSLWEWDASLTKCQDILLASK